MHSRFETFTQVTSSISWIVITSPAHNFECVPHSNRRSVLPSSGPSSIDLTSVGAVDLFGPGFSLLSSGTSFLSM